jgi:hypothetical protein
LTLNLYETIFDSYYIFLEKEKLREMIIESKVDELDVLIPILSLNKIKLMDKMNLEDQSIIQRFILTKEYLRSIIFKENLDKMLNLKKKVILFLNESDQIDLKFELKKFQEFKLLLIKSSFLKTSNIPTHNYRYVDTDDQRFYFFFFFRFTTVLLITNSPILLKKTKIQIFISQ